MSEDTTVEVVNDVVDEGVNEPVDNDSVADQTSNEEGTVETSEETKPEEEKIVFNTRVEFDNHAAKVKAKAERKLKRKLDAEYQKKYKELQDKQQSVQSQSNVNTVSPGPDFIWDQNLGWIHKDTTTVQYSDMLNKALSEVQTQPTNQQPTQQQSAPVDEVKQPIASERLIDQLEDLVEEFPDVENVFKLVNINNDNMDVLEVCARYKGGIKTFYEEAKNDPSKILKISSLSDETERHVKMVQLNEAKRNASKKVTKVPSQPEPINGGSSIGVKSPDQMSKEELLERYISQIK